MSSRGLTKIEKLFTPIKINKLELKNRIIWPTTSLGLLISADGTYREQVRDFLAARARGGAGLMLFPGIGPGRIHLFPPGPLPDTAIEALKNKIPRFRELVEVAHANGAKIGMQLLNHGRQGTSELWGYKIVAPSPIPWSKRSEVPRELTTEEIESLVERYAVGASMAQEAGFDMVEIHGAHGYLVCEFLSPLANKRTDKYGGDVKQRARFLIEIIKAIRKRVGPDFPIGCRISGTENIKGGITIEDQKQVAPLLQDAGIDVISVSAGANGSYPVIVAPFSEPYGCYIPLAAEIKKMVSIPVITVGRIWDPWLAEEVLASGKADLIALGRPLWADPEAPNKIRRGEFDEVRKCIACNQGCIDREGTELERTCLVNPEWGREAELKIIPASKTKKVMIIGAGLAGLEAARVAALRGHKVKIYEQANEVGGQWKLVSTLPYKQEFMEIINWLMRQLKKLGVTLELGKTVTPETVDKEKPDAVIIATGARPLVPSFPGAESKNVVTAWDVLTGKASVKGKILVLGGDRIGLETAEFVAAKGNKVIVAAPEDHLGTDMGITIRWHLLTRLDEYGVEILRSTDVKQVNKGSVRVVKQGKEETWQGIDAVVLAVGAVSRNELAEKLRHKVKELYVIGDAAQPRDGIEAMREGTEIGRKV